MHVKNTAALLSADSKATTSPPFVVTRITEGLAFGDGSITSRVDDVQVLSLMDDVIHNSPNILIRVTSDDDGCSDGRPTIATYTQNGGLKGPVFYRAKVFGGSVVMTAACRIGLGMAHDTLLQAVFDASIDSLNQKHMNFGAHTDVQADEPNCGCGAIDRAAEALVAILKYEDKIRGVIAVLGIDAAGLDTVFSHFREYVSTEMVQVQDYRGTVVMEHILAAGKVVKRLGGNHLERRIVMNQVPGYTINQKLIRDITHDRGQVFGVDIWRLQDIVLGLFPENKELQHQALLSELVYTLGTAAVLTKGDLPVDMVEQAI